MGEKSVGEKEKMKVLVFIFENEDTKAIKKSRHLIGQLLTGQNSEQDTLILHQVKKTLVSILKGRCVVLEAYWHQRKGGRSYSSEER